MAHFKQRVLKSYSSDKEFQKDNKISTTELELLKKDTVYENSIIIPPDGNIEFDKDGNLK